MGCVQSTPEKNDGHISLQAIPGSPQPVRDVSVKAPSGAPDELQPATKIIGKPAPLVGEARAPSGTEPASGSQASHTQTGKTAKWERSAVDKGTELIESLSAIDGTTIEKVEAFTNLLISENFTSFASISALSEDERVFMVLTSAGIAADFLPKNFLMSTASTNWSVQKVATEGTACFWGAAEHTPDELPEDWKCLWKTQKLRSFLAVPIKVGTQLCGVLNVALTTEVEEQKHWWGLQLRLLAAVLAQHFKEASLRSKITWLQAISRQDTIEQLAAATLQGLSSMFAAYQDLHFHLALSLPGRPCAIMFSLTGTGEGHSSDANAGAQHKQQHHQHQHPGTAGSSGAPLQLNSDGVQLVGVSTEGLEMNGFLTSETLLESCLETGQVMKVANCRRYLRLYKTGSDVAILYRTEAHTTPASLMAVPLVAPDLARVGGLYVISRTATDFGMVRREVMDLVKLMVPSLQQRLASSELNKKLVAVSEKCRFEPTALSASAVSLGGEGEGGDIVLQFDSSNIDSHKDLVLGSRPEKDALIHELQEQIRRQLAKVYKGHAQDGGGHALDALDVYDELGKGGYGTVYRAVWKGQLAAVKVVADRDTDAGSLNSALELALLTSISHPNIIQIHTYFADVGLASLKFMRNNTAAGSAAQGAAGAAGGDGGDGDGGGVVGGARANNQRQLLTRPLDQMCQVLIMDYCDMGSLADVLNTSLLRHHATGKVALPAILHCLLEIASALHYLHSIGIVHFDLKPENVLLKSSTIDSRGFTCKVADFGLSNIVSDNSYFNKHAEGTITHLAPEGMQPSGKLTRAVDVYAFGIMMWELFTGQRPYLGFRTIDVAVKVAKDTLRPEFPPTTPPKYRALAEQCWQGDRRTRPTFRQVMDRLHEMLKDADTACAMARNGLLTLGPAPTRLALYQRDSDGDGGDFPLHIL